MCHVSLGPISVQNCIIADNHICAGGMSGKGPCRVSIRNVFTMSALYKAILAMYYKRNSFLLTPHSQGDSGGALLAQDRDLLGWSAVGIVSYQPGAECGTDNYVVFTELRSDIRYGNRADINTIDTLTESSACNKTAHLLFNLIWAI